MANQPGGAPYPVGTDKVVDGDDAIRALAAYADQMHQEFSGNTTAPTGSVVNMANLTLVPASSWGSVVTVASETLTILTAGLHTIDALVRFGSALTAVRGFAEVRVNGTPVARSSTGGYEDQVGVGVPGGIYLAAGAVVTIAILQGLGTPQSAFGTVRITRTGPKP